MNRPEPIASMNFEEHNKQKHEENLKREQDKMKSIGNGVQIHIDSIRDLTSEEMQRVEEWANEVVKSKKYGKRKK